MRCPNQMPRHDEWFRFAKVWAELAVLEHDPNGKPNDDQRQEIDALRTRMDAAFARWVVARYAGLANLPPDPPVMLHHIPRFLARQAGAGVERGCLGGDGWVGAGSVGCDAAGACPATPWLAVFERVRPSLGCPRSLPSLGRPSSPAIPRCSFRGSIRGTHKEKALWRRFWADQNVPGVAYAKGLGDGPFDEVAKLAEQPNIRAIGLVVDKVDRIMHGMTLGAAGMHNQVRQWAAQADCAALLDLLLQHGFRVYLTSDHGNIEAMGLRSPRRRRGGGHSRRAGARVLG